MHFVRLYSQTATKITSYIFVALYIICLASFIGCGSGSDGRQAIEGTVTLDGQPLTDGDIRFIPKAGTSSPSAGGKIESGQFTIAAMDGVMAGSFRVEITASRDSGQKVPDQFGNLVEHVVQYLPPKYNRQSILSADIKDDSPNELKFELVAR